LTCGLRKRLSPQVVSGSIARKTLNLQLLCSHRLCSQGSVFIFTLQYLVSAMKSVKVEPTDSFPNIRSNPSPAYPNHVSVIHMCVMRHHFAYLLRFFLQPSMPAAGCSPLYPIKQKNNTARFCMVFMKKQLNQPLSLLVPDPHSQGRL